MINFVVLICIALVAIAIIEWLKKPFPNAPTWVWWGVSPILCVSLGILLDGMNALAVFKGLVAFAIATLFYDNVIKWAKAKLEELGG